MRIILQQLLQSQEVSSQLGKMILVYTVTDNSHTHQPHTLQYSLSYEEDGPPMALKDTKITKSVKHQLEIPEMKLCKVCMLLKTDFIFSGL